MALVRILYYDFWSERTAFWIWVAVFLVLVAGDALLSRVTGVSRFERMTEFYRRAGASSPRTRARIVVAVSRLAMPAILLCVMLVERALYSTPR